MTTTPAFPFPSVNAAAGAALPQTGAPQTRNPESAREAAAEFEAVFLSVMLGQMFAGVKTDGPFGGGQGEEMFRSLLIEQYGTEIAAGGGIGLADDVARELISLQEATDAI